MKIILGLILGLCFAGVGKGQILLGTDIAVNITVEVEDSQMKEDLRQNLSINLRALDRDIVVVGGSATYLVKVQAIRVKPLPGFKPDYVFSAVVTTKEYAAPRRSQPKELIDKFLGNRLLLTGTDQLKQVTGQLADFAATVIRTEQDVRISKSFTLRKK